MRKKIPLKFIFRTMTVIALLLAAYVGTNIRSVFSGGFSDRFEPVEFKDVVGTEKTVVVYIFGEFSWNFGGRSAYSIPRLIIFENCGSTVLETGKDWAKKVNGHRVFRLFDRQCLVVDETSNREYWISEPMAVVLYKLIGGTAQSVEIDINHYLE